MGKRKKIDAKPVLVSGVQPTGRLHIGNYLGALKNFVDLQNSGRYQCHFFIADLHSLTEAFAPKEKSRQILELLADFLAAGLDSKKSVIFLQSQIPAHSELAWIFNVLTSMGELERMTQFKEKGKLTDQIAQLLEFYNIFYNALKKERDHVGEIEREFDLLRAKAESMTDKEVAKKISELARRLLSLAKLGVEFDQKLLTFLSELSAIYKKRSSVNIGLLAYPILMAADVLLYDAKYVPVGEDQLQHLELMRTLARKFNARFPARRSLGTGGGKTFTEPQPLLTEAPRVMSLLNPAKKMSKSESSGCLFIDDSPAEIRKKVMRAVTDSGTEIKYDSRRKPAVSNLLKIYSVLSGEPVARIEKRFKGKGYAAFKAGLAGVIIKYFEGFRKKKSALLAEPATLKSILASGSKSAGVIATRKIREVKKNIGLSL